MAAAKRRRTPSGKSHPITKKFPVFAPKEYETLLNSAPYEVGVDDDYPAELRERLSAAVISYIMQNKSIDYTRKRYLRGQYQEDPSGKHRVDRRIREACLLRISALIEGLVEFRGKVTDDSTTGEFLSDASFHRAAYSIRRAFAEADKGALYESVVIVRMALEQICWAVAVRGSDDPSRIRSTSATKSITPIARRYPRVGRLNGWLSDHAHWDFDAHVKAIFGLPGYILHATSPFKACAYAALIVFCDQFEKVMANELGEFIDWSVVTNALARSSAAMSHDAEAEFAAIKTMIVAYYPDIGRIG